MIRRPLLPADVPGLGWVPDGTRIGVATAVAAGADRGLVLGAFGAGDGRAVGVLAVARSGTRRWS